VWHANRASTAAATVPLLHRPALHLGAKLEGGPGGLLPTLRFQGKTWFSTDATVQYVAAGFISFAFKSKMQSATGHAFGRISSVRLRMKDIATVCTTTIGKRADGR
jgi:hypothetical protein